MTQEDDSKPCERRKTTFKHLKQVLNAESQIPYSPDAVLYHQINAPPRLRPSIKVSDLSGIPTSYTDPVTGLYYASTAEFDLIRCLPSHVINGYLSLRGVPTV